MSGCAAMADGPHPASTHGVAAQAQVTDTTIPAHMSPVKVELIYKLLVAEFALKRGQYPLALQYYSEVARGSREAVIAERAVRIAMMTRDNENGLEAARLWALLAKPNHNARQVYAAFLLRVARIEEATKVLSELSAEFVERDDSQIFSRIATMLSRVKPAETSIQVMRTIVAKYPDNVGAQYALAQILGRFDKPEQAKEVLDRVQKLDPGHEGAAIYIARILAKDGKKIDALNGLAEFLEAYPDGSTVRLGYARLLVEVKRHDEALAEFEKLAEATPDNTDITYALGLLLLQTNKIDAAEVQFKKLIKSTQRRPAAWYYLGQIAESRKQMDDAIYAYKYVDRGEHRLNAQIRIAVLLDNQGKLKSAREQLHGINAHNRQEIIRVGRAEAEILRRNEKLEAALEVYNSVLEQFPKDTGLLYARAMLAVRLDKLDIVESDLREIIGREPDNADALNALGYTLADRTERYAEAHELIKRAYELKPDDHYIVDSLGWVLYRMGRNDEALKLLRQAMKIKADPEIAAHLGEVLWVMGGTAEAREVWDTALKIQPDDKRLLDVIKRFEN